MDRRGFLGSILALGAAPAIVKAEILMPVRKIVVVDHAAMLRELVARKMEEIKRDMELVIIEYGRLAIREEFRPSLWASRKNMIGDWIVPINS